jgi:hypothetical protein
MAGASVFTIKMVSIPGDDFSGMRGVISFRHNQLSLPAG